MNSDGDDRRWRTGPGRLEVKFTASCSSHRSPMARLYDKSILRTAAAVFARQRAFDKSVDRRRLSGQMEHRS